ncbi:putative membrane protein [Streptococcus mitis]|uniref:Putative membrane protein n=1 Tax=Streptococcus mitis TaxID=28037 RepID=A0A081PWT0_STRMT|nr:hypothetical protein [Streptococcus mitis]KEQ35153.1 putative membrane protein [Streptococcus mitis]
MLNKNNNQTHYGHGNQYIDQSITTNIFLTYGDPQPSSSSDNSGMWIIIFLVITLSLGNLLLGFIQEHKQVITMTQIILLIVVNCYVYFKSKDMKLLITEMVPSVLSTLTTIFSVSNQIPANFQSILDKMSTNPDLSSWKTAVNSFFSSLIPKAFELLSYYPSYNIVLTAFYIILVLSTILSPLLIGFNAFFKKSIKNSLTYVFTIAYWIFFFVLKMIQ